MYKDDNTWLDADRLPTMGELCEFFKTHDFTTLQVYGEGELAGIVQSVPAHEDFSHKQQNFPAADFDRKWNHSRAKVAVELVDEIDEQTAYAEEVSEIVFANERFASFWRSLSEDDQTILMYTMNGMTQAEIAEKMGFKTHSAVGKRLAKLKQKFIEA